MLSSNDFKKRPRRSASHRTIDGMLPGNTFKKAGSISFQPASSKTVQSVGAMDNFNRPDGFISAQQPSIPQAMPAPLGGIGGADRTRPRKSISEQPKVKKGRFWRRNKVRKERSRRYKIIKRSILTLLAIFILISGFLGWKFVHNASKVFKGNIFGIFSTTKLKGEDQGRVNILLTGNSADDPGHDGALLTDSIMVISIDTQHNNGFIMSIPRDLWVKYGTNSCSFGTEGKINAVYECGEEIKFKQDGYPDGGIGLLEKDIHDDFGLNINYYVKINYTAFKDAVNAVGGVPFTVKTDDPRGIYDGNISKADKGPLKLTTGLHVLDGQTALNLARARCDTVCYGFTRGDFDRTEHQRELLLTLKDKALSAGVLSNPAKISSLLDAVGNNVQTNFQTNEIRRLYDIGKLIQNQNIQSVGLADTNVNLVTTGMIGNSSVVKPVAGLFSYSQIQAYLLRIMSNDPVVKEGATAVVLNGSGVSGLAKQTADALTAKGIAVVAVANTTAKPTTAVVFLNPKKTVTNTYLSQKFKVTSTTDTTANPEAKNYNADFVIILGANEASSMTTTSQ
jgi:LCP family protein required for cell wall assembly